MPKTNDDSIEVIWHRHPQVWVLIVFAFAFLVAAAWALFSRMTLLHELERVRAEVRTAQQQLTATLADSTRSALQHAKEMSGKADALRLRDQQVLELQTELASAQAETCE